MSLQCAGCGNAGGLGEAPCGCGFCEACQSKGRHLTHQCYAPEPTCRDCGCTEQEACKTVDGTCLWAELPGPDGLGLCSECLEPEESGLVMDHG